MVIETDLISFIENYLQRPNLLWFRSKLCYHLDVFENFQNKTSALKSMFFISRRNKFKAFIGFPVKV